MSSTRELHEKLQSSSGCVLLLLGSFCPVHYDHIRVLELARKHLVEERSMNVIGGYMCPLPDILVQWKMTKKEHILSTEDRLQMCKLAASDSTWIMVDDWCAQQNPPDLLFLVKTIEHFKNLLGPHIQVIHICGADSLPRYKSIYTKELIVAVIQRPIEFDFNSFLLSPDVKPYRQNVIVVYDKEAHVPISSTNVREKISSETDIHDALHPLVLKYHRENNITYKKTDESRTD